MQLDTFPKRLGFPQGLVAINGLQNTVKFNNRKEAIQKFTLLLPGGLKKMAPNLEHLDQWITISIYDINLEISDLMSKQKTP